MVAQLYSSDI